MSAGTVDHETGPRDIAELGGLARHLPRTAALACVAAAAMAGLPPLNGFVSKELAMDATLHATGWPSWLWPAVVVAGSVLTTAYALRFTLGAFFGSEQPHAHRTHPHEPPAGMRLPVEVLVALCIAAGIAPMAVSGRLLDAAAGAVTGTPAHLHLALWHGANAALVMS